MDFQTICLAILNLIFLERKSNNLKKWTSCKTKEWKEAEEVDKKMQGG